MTSVLFKTALGSIASILMISSVALADVSSSIDASPDTPVISCLIAKVSMAKDTSASTFLPWNFWGKPLLALIFTIIFLTIFIRPELATTEEIVKKGAWLSITVLAVAFLYGDNGVFNSNISRFATATGLTDNAIVAELAKGCHIDQSTIKGPTSGISAVFNGMQTLVVKYMSVAKVGAFDRITTERTEFFQRDSSAVLDNAISLCSNKNLIEHMLVFIEANSQTMQFFGTNNKKKAPYVNLESASTQANCTAAFIKSVRENDDFNGYLTKLDQDKTSYAEYVSREKPTIHPDWSDTDVGMSARRLLIDRFLIKGLHIFASILSTAISYIVMLTYAWSTLALLLFFRIYAPFLIIPKMHGKFKDIFKQIAALALFPLLIGVTNSLTLITVNEAVSTLFDRVLLDAQAGNASDLLSPRMAISALLIACALIKAGAMLSIPKLAKHIVDLNIEGVAGIGHEIVGKSIEVAQFGAGVAALGGAMASATGGIGVNAAIGARGAFLEKRGIQRNFSGQFNQVAQQNTSAFNSNINSGSLVRNSGSLIKPMLSRRKLSEDKARYDSLRQSMESIDEIRTRTKSAQDRVSKIAGRTSHLINSAPGAINSAISTAKSVMSGNFDNVRALNGANSMLSGIHDKLMNNLSGENPEVGETAGGHIASSAKSGLGRGAKATVDAIGAAISPIIVVVRTAGAKTADKASSAISGLYERTLDKVKLKRRKK